MKHLKTLLSFSLLAYVFGIAYAISSKLISPELENNTHNTPSSLPKKIHRTRKKTSKTLYNPTIRTNNASSPFPEIDEEVYCEEDFYDEDEQEPIFKSEKNRTPSDKPSPSPMQETSKPTSTPINTASSETSEKKYHEYWYDLPETVEDSSVQTSLNRGGSGAKLKHTESHSTNLSKPQPKDQSSGVPLLCMPAHKEKPHKEKLVPNETPLKYKNPAEDALSKQQAKEIYRKKKAREKKIRRHQKELERQLDTEFQNSRNEKLKDIMTSTFEAVQELPDIVATNKSLNTAINHVHKTTNCMKAELQEKISKVPDKTINKIARFGTNMPSAQAGYSDHSYAQHSYSNSEKMNTTGLNIFAHQEQADWGALVRSTAFGLGQQGISGLTSHYDNKVKKNYMKGILNSDDNEMLSMLNGIGSVLGVLGIALPLLSQVAVHIKDWIAPETVEDCDINLRNIAVIDKMTASQHLTTKETLKQWLKIRWEQKMEKLLYQGDYRTFVFSQYNLYRFPVFREYAYEFIGWEEHLCFLEEYLINYTDVEQIFNKAKCYKNASEFRHYLGQAKTEAWTLSYAKQKQKNKECVETLQQHEEKRNEWNKHNNDRNLPIQPINSEFTPAIKDEKTSIETSIIKSYQLPSLSPNASRFSFFSSFSGNEIQHHYHASLIDLISLLSDFEGSLEDNFFTHHLLMISYALIERMYIMNKNENFECINSGLKLANHFLEYIKLYTKYCPSSLSISLMHCHNNFVELEEIIKKLSNFPEGNPIKSWEIFLSNPSNADIFPKFKEIGKNITDELLHLYCLAASSKKKAYNKIESILRRTKKSNDSYEIHRQICAELDECIFQETTLHSWILFNNAILHYISPENKKSLALIAPLIYAQIRFFTKIKKKITQKKIKKKIKNNQNIAIEPHIGFEFDTEAQQLQM